MRKNHHWRHTVRSSIQPRNLSSLLAILVGICWHALKRIRLVATTIMVSKDGIQRPLVHTASEGTVSSYVKALGSRERRGRQLGDMLDDRRDQLPCSALAVHIVPH